MPLDYRLMLKTKGQVDIVYIFYRFIPQASGSLKIANFSDILASTLRNPC